MTAVAAPRPFRHFAAPTAHGAALIDPPLPVYGDRIAENRRLAELWELSIGERSIASLRQLAREEMIRASVKVPPTSTPRDSTPGA